MIKHFFKIRLKNQTFVEIFYIKFIEDKVI